MTVKIKLLYALTLLTGLSSLTWAESSYKNPFPGFNKQCYPDVPAIDNQVFDYRTTPVDIHSDQVVSPDNEHVTFSGAVHMTQGNRTLHSDYTSYDRTKNIIDAGGVVNYRDGHISVNEASYFSSDLTSNESFVKDPKYQLHGSPTHGEAKKAYSNKETGTYHFENATITTCPKDSETWHLSATSVDVDNNEVFGEAWNTVVWFHDVPVFYLPYFNFPIKNQRKTGFLYPSIAYGKTDGIQLIAPFYWNIAPNYDYTLTPSVIGHRGVLTGHEFRYMLTPKDTGSINFEYIGNDKLAEKEGYYTGHRWYLNYNHASSFFDGKVAMGVSYRKVNNNDYNYFNDYTTTSGSTDKLAQSAFIRYNPDKFTTINLSTLNYQMLIHTSVKPFELLPKLSVNNFMPFDKFSLMNYAEIANFTHDSSYKASGNYNAKRIHLQTKMDFPIIQQPFFQLDSSIKLMYTKYFQDQDGDSLNSYYKNVQGFSKIEGNPDRFVPAFKIKARLIMDNEFSLLGNLYNQSFEPHIQYVYVPHRNQDHIGLYDTTDTIQDYYSLFSDNRYVGYDRISNENRISVGFTSTISDNKGHDLAQLTMGQAYFLEDEKVKLYPKYDDTYGSKSYFNSMLDIRPMEKLLLTGSIIYNNQDHNLYRGFAAAEYSSDFITSQINYRYTRLGNRTMFTNKKVDLRQLGAHIALPLTENLGIKMAAYYDLEQKRNIDRVIKMQYDNCCWRLNVFVEQVNEPDNVTLKAHEETKYGIQFMMKGLGNIGNSNVDYTLSTRLLPYYRPFNISE